MKHKPKDYTPNIRGFFILFILALGLFSAVYIVQNGLEFTPFAYWRGRFGPTLPGLPASCTKDSDCTLRCPPNARCAMRFDDGFNTRYICLNNTCRYKAPTPNPTIIVPPNLY